MSMDIELSKKITKIIEAHSPSTVESLIEQAQRELGIPSDILVDLINDLHEEGKIDLTPSKEFVTTNVYAYILSPDAIWFWAILSISVITMTFVFFIADEAFPFILVRNIIGSLFVLVIPGFSLVKALFPSKELDKMEKAALSLGMSVMVVPLIGLLLNSFIGGISIESITICVFIFTILFTAIGVIREFNFHKR